MKSAKVLCSCAIAACITVSSAIAADADITPDRARELALSQVDGGRVLEQQLHRGGQFGPYYRFEVEGSDGFYHMEVDAQSGRLIQLARKHGPRRGSASAPGTSTAAEGQPFPITFDRATEIALERSGGGVVVESEVDRKRNGRMVYEFEIYNNGTRYEMDVDSATGDIIEFEQSSSRRGRAYDQSTRLSTAEAERIAMDRVGGNAMVVKYKLDRDDGRIIHEIDLRGNGRRYEVEIEDVSGGIIEYSEK